MSRLKYHSSFLHAYLIEMGLLLSIYLFLNIHNLETGRNHAAVFLVVVMLQYVLSHVIVRKLPIKYIYLLVPATLIVLLAAGDYFLSALLISTIPMWRLEQLHYSLSDTYAPVSVVAGLVLLIIINVLSTPQIDAHINTFSIIFIVMLVGYIAGKILSLAMDSGYGSASYLRLTTFFIVLFLASGVAAGFLYRLVTFGMNYAVIFLLNAFVFMLRPFFDFLEGVELDYPDELFEEDESGLDGYQQPEEVVSETDQILNVPFGALILTAIIIAVIFAIYSYFKNREVNEAKDPYTHQKQNIADKKQAYKTPSKKPPEDQGRRLYFDFEKWAASKGYGRYHDETIEQWFARLSLHEYASIAKLEYYQNLRYKDKALSDEELLKLKSYIKEFKDIISRL